MLITGGTGLVGKYLTQGLASEYEIVIADIIKPNFDIKFYKETQVVQLMERQKSLISSDLAKVVLKYSRRDKVFDIFK